jgi:peptidoglycan/xylan/chitin deacetylase (PgdA/CDA1 family)
MKKATFIILITMFFIGNCFAGPSKKVVLTFDDGPHPGSTRRILEVLRRNNVTATFFLVGLMMQKYPQLVNEIYDSGCEIGNHTYEHRRLTKMKPQQIIYSLKAVNGILERITGEKTILFRPPGGQLNKQAIDIINTCGFHTVLWTRYASDTAVNITKEKIIKRSVNNPRDIEIIMLHDGPEETIEALPGIISFYKTQGYEFLNVSEMMLPLFDNMDYACKKVDKKLNEEMAVISAVSGFSEYPEDEGSHEKLIGMLMIFASMGSTFYIVSVTKSKKKRYKAALVFLGIRKKYIKEVVGILEENNIHATFFLTNRQLEVLGKMNDMEINNHGVAFLEKDSDFMKKSKLISWKSKIKKCGYSMVPLYYSNNEYTDNDIDELTNEGFRPVKWKISMPEKDIENLDELKHHLMKSLKKSKVIPIRGDVSETIKLLPELIKDISLKGYSFIPLNQYLHEKYQYV